MKLQISTAVLTTVLIRPARGFAHESRAEQCQGLLNSRAELSGALPVGSQNRKGSGQSLPSKRGSPRFPGL